MIENTTSYDNIDIKPNPIGKSTPLISALSAETGEDQFTVAAKLDSKIREEEMDRMMNPTGYASESEPFDIVRDAAQQTRVEGKHPELDIADDQPTTDEQAPGADQFSANQVDQWDAVSEWANAQQPDDTDISAENFAMNDPLDAGSVNGDSDMTNQSLDFMNSIEPTPEPQGPEVDLVPDEEGADTGEVNEAEEDPTLVAGDEI
ncbi:MAG: hypothetical protein J6Q22_22175 [Prevotella sp.]|nr:hypothetical protein [Prevotella sp.]